MARWIAGIEAAAAAPPMPESLSVRDLTNFISHISRYGPSDALHARRLRLHVGKFPAVD